MANLTPRLSLFLLALAAIPVLMTGCGGSDSVVAPQFEPEIVNQADSFEFQATGVDGATQTLNYSWVNTGTQANIDQSCNLTAGAATLTIRDEAGVLVYSRDLSEGGSYQSDAGTPGTWQIHLAVTGMYGDLNFRAQKTT